MRLRLFAASLAAALAVALCAVPAFADNITLSNGDYGSVTVSVVGGISASDLPPFGVGMYRVEDGITLVGQIPVGFHIDDHYVTWYEGDSLTPIDVPVGTPLIVDSTGSYRYFVYDSDNHQYAILYTVTSLGDVGNSQTGLFGIITQSISNVTDWMDSYISGVVSNPILLFFCLALPLLTIGITIIRRLLATRA